MIIDSEWTMLGFFVIVFIAVLAMELILYEL